MTATLRAGAASHDLEWHAINWRKVSQNVNRLQARIVQATQAGRWGKVKALQRLLTHSFSAKALAVRRVTENQGKWTPGIDGEIWETPAKKAAALQTLRTRGYQPPPVRRVYIPKSRGRTRPLGIPTMKDRAMQALHLLALDPIAETQADPNSYGFRKERSTADAMERCHHVLSRKNGASWVLEGDIHACFERISHTWLEAHVPMDTTLLHKWLKAGIMEQQVVTPTEAGTPQGGILSPVLANLALDGLEARLRDQFPPARRAKVNLARYADDFLVTGSSRELLETEVQPLVEQFFQERGLTLSVEKTCITPITEGIDFLGQHIRRYRDRVLITPARDNVAAFLQKVRSLIKGYPQIPAGRLIVLLNPLIRGWANYHRHSASKDTFRQVDNAIFQAVWAWAKRRHPNKPRRWIRQKYFQSVGMRHWVFFGRYRDKRGRETLVHLFSAASVPITRHGKIKGAANPYDPAWAPYFEARRVKKMAGLTKDQWMLRTLWKEQNGRCLVCEQPLSETTGWNQHHLVGRTERGPNTVENLVLLHPTCHQQVHSQGISVGKPRAGRCVGKA